MSKETTTITNPYKLNNGMITALSEAIAKGNYIETACNLVGIYKSTLYDWLHQAEDDRLARRESIFTTLHDSLKKAEAEAESKLVSVVREAAEVKREWLPAMTFLERRHPDRWGRKDRTAITIDEHKSVTITRVTVVLPPGMDAGQIVEGQVRELPEGKADDPD